MDKTKGETMKTLMSLVLICGLNGQDFEISETPTILWKSGSIQDTILSKFEYYISDITDTIEWIGDSVLVNIPYYTDEIASLIYQNLMVINLLALYEQYEAECYNDSTLVIWDSGPEIEYKTTLDSWGRKILDLTGVESVPAILLHHEEWEHKEATFQGFMEWIKEKQ